jgi:hypothetical protein
VDLLGRYSNPDNVSRLNRILSGQGRDRPSHRPVPSVRQQQTRLTDSQQSELLDRYPAGEPASALAKEFGVHRATVFSSLPLVGVQTALSHPQRRRRRGRAEASEVDAMTDDREEAGLPACFVGRPGHGVLVAVARDERCDVDLGDAHPTCLVQQIFIAGPAWTQPVSTPDVCTTGAGARVAGALLRPAKTAMVSAIAATIALMTNTTVIQWK